MPTPLWVAIAAMALLGVAVWSDLRWRIIPDTVPLLLIALGLAAAWLGWQPNSMLQVLLGLAAGLLVGAALFYLGAMGGGDAKLCAALGALGGLQQWLEVLFATALAGGLLALWARRRQQIAIPYAPAFAAGYATTIAIVIGLPPHSGLWSLVTGRLP